MSTTIQSPADLNSALAEDLRTRWIPDVVNFADATSMRSQMRSGRTEFLEVPTPGGGSRIRAVLSLEWLVALHEVTEPVRARVDALLAPEVCGYRTGSVPGSAYSHEFQRFTEIASGLAADFPVVVTADVSDFFANISLARLLQDLSSVGIDPTGIGSVLHALEKDGVLGLPAGYCDSRMLANVYLRHADAVLGGRFARWVDDYRVFGENLEDAHSSLRALGDALERVGLRLNPAKTKVSVNSQSVEQLRLDLASVYHPVEEGLQEAKRSLRRVFVSAVAADIPNRRKLRFCLPRLAELGDDYAVPYCMEALSRMPWEAPRMVAYLTHFWDRPTVHAWAAATVGAACSRGDNWLVARIVPLLCRTGFDDATSDTLAQYVQVTPSAEVGGLILRSLALAGYTDDVARLTVRPGDPRAAVAATSDVALPAPAWAISAAPWMSGAVSWPAPSSASDL
jgi:hypothetical protein